MMITKINSIDLCMRSRIWDELSQAKHHEFYCTHLLARQRRVLNYFNMLTLILSSAGIMGWAIWKSFPLMACGVISAVQLAKLLQAHIIPSEKQIDKLDYVSDFYFDYYNNLEKLWYDYENGRLNDEKSQEQYYAIKATEKDTNKVLKEIIKTVNKSIQKIADEETLGYLNRTFKQQ